MSVVGYRFEFDLSLSPSSSLSSVRPSDQGSESEFEGSWEVSSEGSLVPCLPDADLWGKVRGEKGR